MATILVTGGAGFIGSHIVAALLEQKHSIRILDNLTTGRLENLPSKAKQVQFIQGDIRDESIVRQAAQGVDYIFHLAAQTTVTESVIDPITNHAINCRGTLNLLQVAHEQNIKRFIFSSSSAVYGEQKRQPVSEEQTPQPASPYGLSKLIGEQYAQQFSHLYNLPTVCLRYFNVFGPRQHMQSEYAGVVPKFITALLQNKPVIIYGSGQQTRDFVYVDNVVAANLAAMKVPARQKIVICNIASGQPIAINDLLQAISQVVGAKPQINHQPKRPGEIQNSAADISLARRFLKYTPTVNYQDGLAKTIAWYQQQDPTRSRV